MNPEKVLTIAIPAYNASKFLPKCLQSLVDSNELERMEVLVIDDGSKESQDEVVRPYIDRFPQSIQMIHKENGGHGSVINKAAEIATGKYLKILDADDWVVSKNMKLWNSGKYIPWMILRNFPSLHTHAVPSMVYFIALHFIDQHRFKCPKRCSTRIRNMQRCHFVLLLALYF